MVCLVVPIIALVLLILNWIWGEQTVVTKLIFTGVLLASFVPGFLGEWGVWIQYLVQALLALVLYFSTFVKNFPKR